jgi:hypothetical protein
MEVIRPFDVTRGAELASQQRQTEITPSKK